MTDPLFDKKMDRRDKALVQIRNALMLEDPYILAESSTVLAKFLTEQELLSFGFSVLQALPYEIALEFAQSVLNGAGSGQRRCVFAVRLHQQGSAATPEVSGSVSFPYLFWRDSQGKLA